MKLLTIGKVAESAGVGIETVRFYEREGLLDKPMRSASGYRQFNDDVVKRLMFISRAKELGFTLKEIKELLSLRVDPEICCEDVKAKADVKIANIESKIATLRKMKKALVRLSLACGERERERRRLNVPFWKRLMVESQHEFERNDHDNHNIQVGYMPGMW